MITITIRTDNAAFDPLYEDEIGRVLARLAQQFIERRSPSVRDSNGNTVGTVKITGRDRMRL